MLVTMRLGSFNVENLFERPVAMSDPDPKVRREVLATFAALSQRLGNQVYSPADKAAIMAELTALGLGRADDAGPFAILRQNHGRLVKRSANGTITAVVANGRSDWVGFVGLKSQPIAEVATRNTAKVIADVDADVLGIVEVENRPVLRSFAGSLVADEGGVYPHSMVIDGNDDRGIDVGVLTKARYPIVAIRSHIYDRSPDGKAVFSRDCAEYEIATPSKERLLVLVNHLKSKGFGKQKENDAKREAQARRIAQIYRERRKAGYEHIAVVGDFNDVPGSSPLAPLLAKTNLRDITEHPTFVSDGRPGTFGNGTAANKIDYVLLSPSLFAKVHHGAINRKGVWGGTNGTLWPHYDTMTSKIDQASDHAAIYADIDL